MNLISTVKQHDTVCTAALLIVIICLSLLPLPELPEMPNSDKTGHLIAYAALMFPTALRRPQKWLLIGLCFIVFSGVIELIQPFVNRYTEWQDLLANTTGLLLGAVIGRLADWISCRGQT